MKYFQSEMVIHKLIETFKSRWTQGSGQLSSGTIQVLMGDEDAIASTREQAISWHHNY